MIRQLIDADYFALPGLSCSDLKNLSVSPRLYRHYKEVGQAASPAQELGSLVHCAVLTPDRLLNTYACYDGRRAGKDYEAFLESVGSRSVVKKDDYSFARKVAESVDKSPLARELLESLTHIETTLTWSVDDIACKGKIDGYSEATKTLIDLKTTSNSRSQFTHDIYKYKYHWQGHWYATGLAANGLAVERVILIAVGKTDCLEVNCFELSSEYLELAEAELNTAVELYKQCSVEQTWPSWSGGKILLARPPKWVYNQINCDNLDEDN